MHACDETDPVLSFAFPAAQLEQADAPTLSEKVPIEQYWHADSSVPPAYGFCFPVVHEMQRNPSSVSKSLNDPLGHKASGSKQMPPSEEAWKPGVQVQLVGLMLLAGASEFIGQGSQLADPASAYVFTGHP